MKALVIDEPWISSILRGEKLWEMRKRACKYRGLIALIRKGSGLVVGTATVTDCRPPLMTRPAYSEAERFHRIPPARQEKAFADGWTIPWVLSGARSLPRPVPYQHPSGAVVSVNLVPEVAALVQAQVQ